MPKKFNCELCGYSTDKKSSYKAHNNTKKHKENQEKEDKNINKETYTFSDDEIETFDTFNRSTYDIEANSNENENQNVDFEQIQKAVQQLYEYDNEKKKKPVPVRKEYEFNCLICGNGYNHYGEYMQHSPACLEEAVDRLKQAKEAIERERSYSEYLRAMGEGTREALLNKHHLLQIICRLINPLSFGNLDKTCRDMVIKAYDETSFIHSYIKSFDGMDEEETTRNKSNRLDFKRVMCKDQSAEEIEQTIEENKIRKPYKDIDTDTEDEVEVKEKPKPKGTKQKLVKKSNVEGKQKKSTRGRKKNAQK